MNLQFGFFVSYIALFILGVRGGERGWFNAVTAVSGKRWLTAGLLGIPVWFALILCSGAAQGQPSHIEGGWHWQAAAYALWEGGVAIAMSLGLVVFFRRFVSWDHAFLRLLSRHSFRIYMFHTPVLVALSVAVAGWHAPMLLKHVVVAPLACFASLLVAMVLSRVPGVEPITR
jgi:surface polysaccharide O-acyltransferase-like enzyme